VAEPGLAHSTSGALNESDDVLAKDKHPAGWRANFYPTGLNDPVVASAYEPSVPA